MIDAVTSNLMLSRKCYMTTIVTTLLQHTPLVCCILSRLLSFGGTQFDVYLDELNNLRIDTNFLSPSHQSVSKSLTSLSPSRREV